MRGIVRFGALCAAVCFLVQQGVLAQTAVLHAETGTGTGPIHWTAEGPTVGDDLKDVGGTASFFPGRMPNHRLFAPVQDATVAASEPILTVTVRALARSDVDLAGTYDGIKVAINIAGTVYWDPAIDEVGIGYEYYIHTWDKNPATGSAWTWADVNALQAGVISAKSTQPTETVLYCDYVEVIVSYGAGNAAPVASDVGIAGTPTVGQVLTGSYTYSDEDGDLEGASLYRWYRADDELGSNTAALSERTELTCEIPLSAEGKYVYFEVTPVAKTGVPTGMPVRSAMLGPVAAATGSAPVAANVEITGIDTVGNTLEASYTYSDADGDFEGPSTYRWIRSGFVIAGADGMSYTLTKEDEGKLIVFEVTPISATGAPTIGDPAASVPFGPIQPAPGSAPTVSDVVISGENTIGSTLTGTYSFEDVDGDADASTFQWMRDGSPIGGATAITYEIKAEDAGAELTLQVTPVSATGTPKEGTPVVSNGITVEHSTALREASSRVGARVDASQMVFNLRGQVGSSRREMARGIYVIQVQRQRQTALRALVR